MRALSQLLLLSLFIFALSTITIISQTTPQPTPPSGTNDVYLDSRTNSYVFRYLEGSVEKLRYTYSRANGGYLNGLTATTNGQTFHPSNGGGLYVQVPEGTYYSWQTSNVSFELLYENLEDNVLYTKWRMTINTGINTYYYVYHHIMYIEGKTLVFRVLQNSNQEDNYAAGYDLDRCEGTGDAYIIGIPYLPMFNILLKNDVYTSSYFDWLHTNASRLDPKNSSYSSTSKYFSQNAEYKKKTDGYRNEFDEIFYLTVSENLEEVFPNIPNPVNTTTREQSINSMVWDWWYSFGGTDMDSMYINGLRNLWIIVHDWQYYGYDIKFPAGFTAARPSTCSGYSGDVGLERMGDSAYSYNYLFSVHENYVDYHSNASPYFLSGDAVYDSDNNIIPYYCFDANSSVTCPVTVNMNGFCSNILNSSKAPIYMNYFAPNIHDNYKTTASYLDVHSSYNPSRYVDYDATEQYPAMFKGPHTNYSSMGNYARSFHEGPVSGEGLCHFLYAGYFDDFEAEIHSGKDFQGGYGQPWKGGYYFPVNVDFELLKLRPKTFSHGVGYDVRFFYVPNSNYGQYIGRDIDSQLIYMATTLAYGHGGWIPPKGNVPTIDNDPVYGNWNAFIYALKIQKHIYSMQALYGDEEISSILYNDNGKLVTASDYIRSYPLEHEQFYDTENISNYNFMSQIRIEYKNGVVVYVNRHPSKPWNDITLGSSGGWYNYHAYINGSSSISFDTAKIFTEATFSLPPENGWVCYSPNSPAKDYQNKVVDITSPFKFKLSQNYPNPFNPTTEINYEIAQEVGVTIKIYNILGQFVTTLVNNEVKKPGIYKASFDGKSYASGVYFYRIEAGDFVDRKKMVLIK